MKHGLKKYKTINAMIDPRKITVRCYFSKKKLREFTTGATISPWCGQNWALRLFF
jgi:hypothetical protein